MRYLILLCLLASFNVFSETSLWRVSKGKSELFIGGTIHILSANDYPLPVEFERAYKMSDQIVFETDLAAMARP
ncbi:MAG: TraB/GumN family protein, partial [Methylococcales bacterium]|nr:TraB/GumN family protein [Methylococcales bacterium]